MIFFGYRVFMVAALAAFAPTNGLRLTQVRGGDSPPGEAVAPEQVKGGLVPSLSLGAVNAVIYGVREKPGPYAYRVKFPPHFQIQAHSHPENRTYTVLSGTFYQGLGDTFDEAKLVPRPAGSFCTYAAGEAHFGATRSEGAVLQIMSCEESAAIRYANPSDDPRMNMK